MQSTQVAERIDADEALRAAAKAAIDAGNVKRAIALLAMLDENAKVTPTTNVVELAARRGRF